MTREEKANKLGQEYFPNENNIWARPNFEAQYVSEACIKMAEWEHKRLVEKVSKWIKENTDWTEEYIWDGRNPNYGLWSELKKFLEE